MSGKNTRLVITAWRAITVAAVASTTNRQQQYLRNHPMNGISIAAGLESTSGPDEVGFRSEGSTKKMPCRPGLGLRRSDPDPNRGRQL